MNDLAGMGERQLKQMGYRKPMSRFGPWVSPLAADESERLKMEMLSQNLLAALWREHGDQLRFAASVGRKVVRL